MFIGVSPLVVAAAQVSPERLFGEMFPWLAAFVVVVLVGGAIAIWLRRRFHANRESSGDGYTLRDLRAMHGRGELTDEEFQMAKDAMVLGLHGDVRRKPDDQVPSA